MKNLLATYYENTRQYYATYHNHKEICAWAGLVIFVVFCGVVLQARILEKPNVLISSLLTLIVLVAAMLAFLYIRNQVEMKDRGGALTAAATFLLAEILQRNESELSLRDYLAVEESRDTKAQSSRVLPSVLLKRADILNTRGRRFQDRTRAMIYGILMLASISAVGFLWMRFIG